MNLNTAQFSLPILCDQGRCLGAIVMMKYKALKPALKPKITPRLIIHGGAGNIKPANLTPERYKEYRDALLAIVRPAASPTTLLHIPHFPDY